MRLCSALLIALGVACARPARQSTETVSPVRVAAALDTATVRRICAAPDSVIAGQRSCVLRDQRGPIRVF